MAYLTYVEPLTIAWGDCDPAGIVFNPRFFAYFDAGAWRMFGQALRLSPQEWPQRYGVIGIPLVASGANFRAPLKFGETAELASTITRFGRSSFDVAHRITSNGSLAVEGLETRVWAGPDPNDPAKLRSVPIPPELIEKFTIE